MVPNPLEADQVLIGYSTGFMMLWDTASRSLLNILKSSTLLLDLCWRSEDEFYSCHSDGSFIVWDAENGAQLQVLTISNFSENIRIFLASEDSLWTLPMQKHQQDLLQRDRRGQVEGV